jgi:tetratricopeptide (TPR) repeat protein
MAAATMAFALGACNKELAPDNASTATAPAVPLFEGLGDRHHPVTTTNELAQKYFDQGMRLLYGFNHDEAERAFREAARLDPGCAMAWWGVAFVLGPNYNLPGDPERNRKAVEAVRKAQALTTNASEPEKAYIEAIAKRYSDDPKADRAKLDREYGRAMKALHERYPDDADAAVLYAESLMVLRPWQLWTADGKPQEGTEEIVKTLEAALQLDPNHTGANHYYIHATEASPNAGRALPSAERLKTLAPQAGHLVHMPAHVFIRTGDYRGAMEANANAARTDEAYIARTKAEGVYPMMYYTHNYMFLATSAAMIGRSHDAVDAAQKAVSIVAPMGHDPMAEYVLPWALYTMARCARWEDILATPQPSQPFTTAMWRYARTLALMRKGSMNEARAERQAMADAVSKAPADLVVNTNRAHDLLNIAGAVLDAKLAAGKFDTAIGFWQKAVDIQDRLVYDEPPAWYYPVRESLGAEYLRAKRYIDAEKTFRRDLEINPNNPRSLYGLSHALRIQGKSEEANEAQARFHKEWEGADVAISLDTL